jgi:hypothetical protein
MPEFGSVGQEFFREIKSEDIKDAGSLAFRKLRWLGIQFGSI